MEVTNMKIIVENSTYLSSLFHKLNMEKRRFIIETDDGILLNSSVDCIESDAAKGETEITFKTHSVGQITPSVGKIINDSLPNLAEAGKQFKRFNHVMNTSPEGADSKATGNAAQGADAMAMAAETFQQAVEPLCEAFAEVGKLMEEAFVKLNDDLKGMPQRFAKALAAVTLKGCKEHLAASIGKPAYKSVTIQNIKGKFYTVIWHKPEYQTKELIGYDTPTQIGYEMSLGIDHIATVLPALPRKPKADLDHIRLMYRYMAEGLLPACSMRDGVQSIINGHYYDCEWYSVAKAGGDSTTHCNPIITHAVRHGARISIAIEE
jgi:hypothetical protein